MILMMTWYYRWNVINVWEAKGENVGLHKIGSKLLIAEIWRWYSCFKKGLLAQLVKNLPAVQEIWVQSLGLDDSLEKEMATHSGILAWKISWTKELQSMGSQRLGHNWATNTSVQFSHSVVSNSLRPHESQHARPPCPSPAPGVHSDSSPSSQWCHPAISSSVVPFSSRLQSLPASKSFPMSQLFACGGQNTGVSAVASFLPKNTQGWSPLEWLVGFPCSPRDSQEPFPTPQFKSINSSVLSFLHSPTFTFIHDHRKNHSLG